MLLNCGVGEFSLKSLRLQRDQTSQSKGNQSWFFFFFSVLNIPWKDWCWSWSSNTSVTWCKELTHWKKNPDAGKDWTQEEKGATEVEMVRWHHWLNGHEFEPDAGVGGGQGSMVCCSPWGCKELDTTGQLNWLIPLWIPDLIFCIRVVSWGTNGNWNPAPAL